MPLLSWQSSAEVGLYVSEGTVKAQAHLTRTPVHVGERGTHLCCVQGCLSRMPVPRIVQTDDRTPGGPYEGEPVCL